jgi:hypothetical protein
LWRSLVKTTWRRDLSGDAGCMTAQQARLARDAPAPFIFFDFSSPAIDPSENDGISAGD